MGAKEALQDYLIQQTNIEQIYKNMGLTKAGDMHIYEDGTHYTFK